MASIEGESVGLVNMAPEVMHLVALSGWLGVRDVAALSQTCRRMADILVWDGYGKDLHVALKGVVANVRGKRWKSAQYAMRRRWFVEGEEGEEEILWRKVAETVAVVSAEKIVLKDEEELSGWEDVLLAALSLEEAGGWLEGWDVEDDGKSRVSLLHIVASVGSERMVDWVVERGGDCEARDMNGATPLAVACTSGNLGVVEKLVEASADVMVKDYGSESLLHAACENGNLEVVRYLLGLGVFDVEERDSWGNSPLGIACLYEKVDMVRLMVEEGGAKVNGTGGDWWTPLIVACREGSVNVVRVLLELGADAGIADAWEGTPLDIARERGWKGVVAVLEEWVPPPPGAER